MCIIIVAHLAHKALLSILSIFSKAYEHLIAIFIQCCTFTTDFCLLLFTYHTYSCIDRNSVWQVGIN